MYSVVPAAGAYGQYAQAYGQPIAAYPNPYGAGYMYPYPQHYGAFMISIRATNRPHDSTLTSVPSSLPPPLFSPLQATPHKLPVPVRRSKPRRAAKVRRQPSLYLLYLHFCGLNAGCAVATAYLHGRYVHMCVYRPAWLQSVCVPYPERYD